MDYWENLGDFEDGWRDPRLEAGALHARAMSETDHSFWESSKLPEAGVSMELIKEDGLLKY